PPNLLSFPTRRSSDLLSSRIAGLQTLATEEGKQMVLSVTLSDGNNVKYLIKLPQADKLQVAATEPAAPEKVSSWEIERLGTALRDRKSTRLNSSHRTI